METAIVAGAGPGLGAALARAFAREGYAVGLLARKMASSAPAAEEIAKQGGKALALAVDVTDRNAVVAAVEKCRAELGPVVTAVPVGIAMGVSRVMRGIFDPPIEFYRPLPPLAYLPLIVIWFGIEETAKVILIFLACFAPLAMAKSALRVLGQSLAREFHPQGIHVLHIIVDGQIDTPPIRARESGRAADTLIPPDAIAAAMIHALKQPKNGWTHEIDIRPAAENF